MKLFEVILAPGGNPTAILSKDVLEETGAQIFTEQEATLVGLEGIPENPNNEDRVFIACSQADEQFLVTRLESAAGVARYKLHDV